MNISKAFTLQLLLCVCVCVFVSLGHVLVCVLSGVRCCQMGFGGHSLEPQRKTSVCTDNQHFIKQLPSSLFSPFLFPTFLASLHLFNHCS